MYDVIVIGSGPGGYVAAIRCAQNGLKTACVDKRKELGGTCLNVGCIPSKALLHASEFYHKVTHEAEELGVRIKNPSCDFSRMMARKNEIVKGFNQGISMLFAKNKVDFIHGEATFTGPNTIKVGDASHQAKHFIIATGSEPTELQFAPFDEKTILSSTGALDLDAVPESMVVVGAGVIGVELGSVYSRLGSKVHFVEYLDRICPTLDPTIGKAFHKILESQGLTFDLSSKVTSVNPVTYENASGTHTHDANVCLVSVGRRPNTQNLGLESLNISLDPQGRIPVDGRFATSQPNVFAIGDVIDGPMLAHKASEEGVAVADLIAGKRSHISYIAIPNVIYTDPEVAAVGLTEPEAQALNIPIKCAQFPFKANSRARCVNATEGLVKIVAKADSGHILGMHIVGANAGELIQIGALALEKKATANELAATSHAHPTLSESLKEAAMAIHTSSIHI